MRLDFDIDPKIIGYDSKTKIHINHHQDYHVGVGFGVNFPPIGGNAAITRDNIHNATIPLSQLKRWRLKEQPYFEPPFNHRQQIEIPDYLADNHNQYLFDLILKHANKIEKLQIELQKEDIINGIFEGNPRKQSLINALFIPGKIDLVKGNSDPDDEKNESKRPEFDQCIVLSLAESNGITLNDSNTFKNLQCLEVTISKYNYAASPSVPMLNSVLQSVSSSLKCFGYCNKRESMDMNTSEINEQLNSFLNLSNLISIPKGVEWCSIQVASNGNIFDLSKCNGLIGVQLIGISASDSNSIIWPQKDIPFICTQAVDQLFVNRIKSKELNIGLMYLLKKEFINGQSSEDRWTISGMYGERKYNFVYDEETDIKRMGIIAGLAKLKQKEKCIVLDKSSDDEMLVYRILEYAVKDENMRNNIIQRLKRWWYLDSAKWIKNIASIASD